MSSQLGLVEGDPGAGLRANVVKGGAEQLPKRLSYRSESGEE